MPDLPTEHLATYGPNPLNPSEYGTLKSLYPPGTMAEIVEAFIWKHNWTPTIPNPDYNPEDPESPETILNPVGLGILVHDKINDWCASIVAEYRIAVGRKALEQDVRSDVEEKRGQVANEWTPQES